MSWILRFTNGISPQRWTNDRKFPLIRSRLFQYVGMVIGVIVIAGTVKAQTTTGIITLPTVSSQLPVTQPITPTLEGFHPVDDIRATALSLLPEGTEGEASVDANVRLAYCGNPLQVKPTNTTTVEVTCSQPTGWRIFVPIKVRRNQEIWVLNQAIPAGQMITSDMLTPEIRDTARMIGVPILDINTLVGQVARRTLPAGTVVLRQDIVSPRLIRRGDQVDLVSQRGGVEVRMQGRALSDAGENERVSVENNSSKKILQGIVRAQGDVLVSR